MNAIMLASRVQKLMWRIIPCQIHTLNISGLRTLQSQTDILWYTNVFYPNKGLSTCNSWKISRVKSQSSVFFLETVIIVILTMDTRYPRRNNELWRVFCEFKVWHTNSLFSLNTKLYFSTWDRALMRSTLINFSPSSVSTMKLKPPSYSDLCILLPVDFFQTEYSCIWNILI